MSLSERVTEAIHSTGRRPAEIARAIGRTPSAVSQLMDGTTKSLKAETAERLEIVTGFRSAWLVGGKGPKRVSANTEPGPDVKGEVPLISWIKAGQWSGANDPLHPGEAERWMPCAVSHSKGTYALRVRGDSMTATHGKSYPDGCIIFVDPERKSPASGERIIAKLSGTDEVTFKVFVQEVGRAWLRPLNAQYPAILDAFKVLGTVIGKWEDE